MDNLAQNSKKTSTETKKKIELTCAACGKLKQDKDYYVSYNKVHSTGRIPYCKDCLHKMISNSEGMVELDKLHKTLQLIDKPFIYDIWKSSLEEKGDSFGVYLKNLAMVQYRNYGWKDSCFEPQLNNGINYEASITKKNSVSFDTFVISDEIYDKWNFGYQKDEYYYFEKKYNQLKNNYPEKTAMHTEALLNYIRYRVKEELATAKGDVKEAKEWGGLAKEAATAAKINPSQLSKADLTDGLSGFGQLTRAVEQAVDIVEILPKFKQKPQDNVDFTLWCYINYVRGLKGLGDCEYKEIYDFYEQKRKDMANKIINITDDLETDEEVLEGEDNGNI